MTMTYAITDGIVITAHGTAKQLWPDVSFPRSGPNAAFLAEHGAVEIRHDLPHDPETHYLRAAEPHMLDGVAYDRVAVQIPPAVPEARWQEFQMALLTDQAVHNMMMQAKDAYPGLISAWSTGLGQSATIGDHRTFFTAWNLARNLPDATGEAPLLPQSLVDHIVLMAVAAGLPAEFIAQLNPEPVAPET